jgi:DNA-binding GntR family transcriptional regulator
MTSVGSSRLLPAAPRNARGQALEIIRQKIITLELAPGSQLSENELAGQLGLSRTPIRESLILLAEEQLVSVVPQVGTLVSPIVEAEIATSQFVRESLELAALGEAVDVVDAGQLADLNAVIAEQRVADERDDTELFFALDEHFHFALMNISQHGSAWRTVSQAKAHLDRARRLSLSLTQQMSTLIDQHQSIVDALAQGDSRAATNALRRHLRKVFDDIALIRADRPELFDPPASTRRR